jgi:hypothetical protein
MPRFGQNDVLLHASVKTPCEPACRSNRVRQIRSYTLATLAPGHSAGALSREVAQALIEEVANARQETQRYREAVAELRRVLDALEKQLGVASQSKKI